MREKPSRENYDSKAGEYPAYIYLSDYFFTKHGAISYMERDPERQDSKGIQRLLDFLTSEEEKEYAVTVDLSVLINSRIRKLQNYAHSSEFKGIYSPFTV